MKKYAVGAVVGGLLIFIWQFLSYALLNLHEPVQAYTEKQDAIMEFLATQNLEEGGYLMPTLPKTATMEEWQAMEEKITGKPWLRLQYHKSFSNNMTPNLIRGLLTNMLIVFIFCWMLGKMKTLSMGTVLAAALGIGLIVFLNGIYTSYIWYKNFDIRAHLADAIISWGLVGLWLGFWMGRGKKASVAPKQEKPSYEMAS
jgi:sensor histidine kinase YesM